MHSKTILISFLILLLLVIFLGTSACKTISPKSETRDFNGPYSGPYLNRVAFPLGGMGAGMVCLEGTGAISHVSVRNRFQFFHSPCTFATICVKGAQNIARVLESQVPGWKIFGAARTGRGADGSSYGFPRFKEASFLMRFPFGTVDLVDPKIPLDVRLTGWSPFIPGDADNSSLPVGALEYSFSNPTNSVIEAVFAYNSKNFMATSRDGHTVLPIKNGFILVQRASGDKPVDAGAFAVFVDDDNTVVDHCWFKGGWWDAMTLAWKNIHEAKLVENPPGEGTSPGASLFVPLRLNPGEEKIVRVMLAWYVPVTDIRFGADPENVSMDDKTYNPSLTYIPWYAGKFSSIEDISEYWRHEYDRLRQKTSLFTKTFYDSTLPPEVLEAVAANLTILKAPTVLRQTDGRLWCYEGCNDSGGCCYGSCTHVWNYAQAIPHLFPNLERTFRRTEFNESQDARGHQTFRSALPIRPVAHNFHAAADGQLGGIMKVYRDWRISGDTQWLKGLWPQVKQSLAYCIQTWDPQGKGILEEPHHNTYDIEYWGPDGHCGSFYLGALKAAIEMGTAVGADTAQYSELLEKGIVYIETELYNDEYFYQKIQTEGLHAQFNPLDYTDNGEGYSDIIDLLNEEGPKYQYGTGCLSDGVLGFWMARVCGLGEIADADMVKSHLKAVHKYNLKHDLSEHANPQRPAYAVGKEGGLLLCTWPRGGALSLPFVYSNEVWTGIEYQVASHLMFADLVEEGLEIVRLCRIRYDGKVRNPFNEYECGHWYARALSSYGLLQGLTGVRYDAVDKTLHIDSRVGNDFRSFLATATGFGTVGLKAGKPFIDMKMGKLEIKHVYVSGELVKIFVDKGNSETGG